MLRYQRRHLDNVERVRHKHQEAAARAGWLLDVAVGELVEGHRLGDLALLLELHAAALGVPLNHVLDAIAGDGCCALTLSSMFCLLQAK